MKMIFLFVLSTSVFASAKVLKPLITLSTFPYQVHVRVQNFSNQDYTCSGQIYMNLSDGSVSSRHYYARVFAHSSDWKAIYPTGVGAQITYARHSVFCF